MQCFYSELILLKNGEKKEKCLKLLLKMNLFPTICGELVHLADIRKPHYSGNSCAMLLTGEKLSKLPVQKGNTNSNHIQEKEGLIGDYYPDGSPWGTHTYAN